MSQRAGQRWVGPGVQLLYRKLGRAPLLRPLLARDYEDRFARNRSLNLFRGVYASFAEATRSAPAELPLGYDHPEPAGMYRERLERIYTNDYPVLFWLGRLLPHVRRLFELGGHVGVAYHAYARHLAYPAGLRWTVCDVPAVAEAGRALALERGARGLDFTSRYEDADGADLFFASGSLQYLERPLAAWLSDMEAPPRHLLLNLLPLHPDRTFVTLQSIGTAYCPYLVQERGAFLRSLEALGYALVDAWDNPDKGCDVPFHEDHSVRGYSGLYLERKG